MKARFKTYFAYQAFDITPNSVNFDWVDYVNSGKFENFVDRQEKEGYRFVTVVMNGGSYALFERIDNEG